jgi:hypothetical protein
MNPLRSLAFAPLCLALFALAACGKDAAKSGGDADHGHSHDEAGPRGGEVQELGDEEGHLELMHDHDGGNIAAYAYGKSLKEPIAFAKPTITVQMKDGSTAEVELTAVEPKPDGTAMGWKGQHAALVSDPWIGRIRLTVAGKTYQNPLEGPAHAHK